jgi:hypothetical protein
MLELTDDGVCVSQLVSPVRPLPLPSGNELAFCGLFTSPGAVHIVAADGAVYRLASGKERGPLVVEFDRPPAPVDGDFSVPPTFWQRAELAVSDLSVVDETGMQLSGVLSGSRGHKTQINRKRMSIEVRSLNPKRAVVGVQIGLAVPNPTAFPDMIVVNGRARKIERRQVARLFGVPLTPREVAAGAPAHIEIVAAGSQIVLTAIDVYVVGAIGRPSAVRDWRLEGTDLRDFIDVADGDCGDEAEFLAVSISAAEFAELGDGDQAALLRLLKLMYQRPKMATVCRRIALKAARSSPSLPRIWARAIHEVCLDGELPCESKSLMARDLALLPPDLRSDAGGAWRAIGGDGGVWAVVASLMGGL